MHLGGGISAKNGEGGGILRQKIVLGGGGQGKTCNWEAGGRVKVVVGGGRQVIIELGGGMLYPCVASPLKSISYLETFPLTWTLKPVQAC